QEKIADKEYNRLQKEIDYERGLAKSGLSYIPNVDAYNKIVKQYGITPANFSNFIYKDPMNGKMYLQPLEEAEDAKLQFIKGTAEQPAGVFNPSTGDFVQIAGLAGSVDPITGVPTDPTKTIQGFDFTSYATDTEWGNNVNNILNNIGQFKTVQDIDNYIQSVASGSQVSGSDIQKVSEEYGVSWELLTAIMQQESHFGTRGLAVGANNPGNVGTTDELAAQGRANTFPTMLEGMRAIGRNIDRRRIDTIGDTGYPTDEDIENLSLEERNVMQAIMRLLPTKLKDALQEKKERQKEVIFSYRQGKSFQTIADEFQGFIISPDVSFEDKNLATNLRVLSTGTGLDLREISAPINLKQPLKAMTNVENANLSEVQGELSEVSSSRSLIQGADRVLDLLKKAPTKYLGKFDGQKFKVKKWFGLSDEDAQKTQRLETAMVNLLNGIRRESLGTAVTEAEIKFLEPLLTSLLDQPTMIKTKMNELKVGTMLLHNEARGTANLPQIDERQLLDNKLRLQVYRDKQISDGLSSEEAYQEYLIIKQQ
ncbi:MAG: hypothetical protein U9P90_02470, partial [Patescibacteria group bacterium]|nr:hypothetical protein [Patescibacteria group bacterium]